MAIALINMPAQARRGEVIEIRALIGHAMETGYRPGADGKVVPLNIIRRFTCLYNGQQVFKAELHRAVSANPYVAFFTVALETGRLEFRWEGDNRFLQIETKIITVTG